MRDDLITYRAKACVGIAGMLLLGLAMLLGLALFGCAACWLWVAVGLPG